MFNEGWHVVFFFSSVFSFSWIILWTVYEFGWSYMYGMFVYYILRTMQSIRLYDDGRQQQQQQIRQQQQQQQHQGANINEESFTYVQIRHLTLLAVFPRVVLW